MDRAKKDNLKRETESLLTAAQNNAFGTNYVKAKIDRTQQNTKRRLCSGRDEKITQIISEYCKLVQKECETRNDWVK